MYILSADTTAKTASVCVCKLENDNLIPVSGSFVNGTLTHSESLLPMIDFCLKNANISFENIDVSAISTGPGSFTGVRIGVATFKGLAFGKENSKCIGVSSLEALAYNLRNTKPGSIIIPVMDARRSQFYHAFFSFTRTGKIKRYKEDSLTEFSEIMTYISENFRNKKIILCGDGANLFMSLYEKSELKDFDISLCDFENMYQNAYSVALAAVKNKSVKKALKSKNLYKSEDLNPIYLRASQAERERNEKLSGGNANGI